jgi:hypothetical protein
MQVPSRRRSRHPCQYGIAPGRNGAPRPGTRALERCERNQICAGHQRTHCSIQIIILLLVIIHFLVIILFLFQSQSQPKPQSKQQQQ